MKDYQSFINEENVMKQIKLLLRLEIDICQLIAMLL